jgi:hypothetical protein
MNSDSEESEESERESERRGERVKIEKSEVRSRKM